MVSNAMVINELDARSAFKHGETSDNRIIDAKRTVESFDGFYLEIKKIVRDAFVWDIGGAAGVDWFRTGKIARRWTVYELPANWYKYSRAMSEANLCFAESIDDFSNVWRGNPQVLYSAGALQYHETPLQFIRHNKQFCDFLILKEIPRANITCLGCQVRVGLSWFLNSDDIIAAMDGFDLISKVGERAPYPYENTVPDGIELYATQNYIFKRK